VCSPRGHVIGDCIAYRLADEGFELLSGMPVLNWVHYHAETGGYDVTVLRDNHSTANLTGRRDSVRPRCGEAVGGGSCTGTVVVSSGVVSGSRPIAGSAVARVSGRLRALVTQGRDRGQ
jgi:hypothetical protein